MKNKIKKNITIVYNCLFIGNNENFYNSAYFDLDFEIISQKITQENEEKHKNPCPTETVSFFQIFFLIKKYMITRRNMK
ncbi:hypothetical protein BpHYR1_018506 [Brachionus plicatilis]|uniref:Uncharacterized protein n=1 Tax=Brachionus plicatilis TaxID=10195 RepID=A0A3M7R0H6_BRAPC|nr:hypothetical protein BpHYR1_018506 [Brachionus plicatilis]